MATSTPTRQQRCLKIRISQEEWAALTRLSAELGYTYLSEMLRAEGLVPLLKRAPKAPRKAVGS